MEEAEVRKIEALKLIPGSPIWHTRNVWLFSFYFAGIRISDALSMKWSDFANDRLYYKMHKNDKPVSVKIPDKIREILPYYENLKTSENDYIFPEMKKLILKTQRICTLRTTMPAED